MIDISPLIMIVSGATLGIVWGVFPNRMTYQDRTYYLQQDWKFRVHIFGLVLVVILIAVTLLTEITFQWVPFFAAVLVSGTLGNVLARVTRTGQLPSRWTNAFQSLYIHEPHRYSRYEPTQLGPKLSLFDPRATEFSLSNAAVFAHLSWIAYRPKDVVEKIAAEWNGPSFFIEKENHVALVLSRPSILIIAFRGTDDYKDWLTNVNILPCTTPWGNVHSGFWSATETVWPEIREALSELREGEQTLWLTGHSLGAAMAVLASVKLAAEERLEVAGIYTFGQPRIGTVSFRNAYDQQLRNKLFRFETPRDEVPNQPGGYFTVGTLKYLDRYGKLQTDRKFWWKFRDQLRRDSLGLLGEHSMLEYLRIVEGLSMASETGPNNQMQPTQ